MPFKQPSFGKRAGPGSAVNQNPIPGILKKYKDKPTISKHVSFNNVEEVFGVFSKRAKDPLINIKVLNKPFTAILDNGASISLVGAQINELIKFLNIPVIPVQKEISWAKGSCVSEKSVNLCINWEGGKVIHNFIIIPELSRPVILGRDFCFANNVIIHPTGWSMGPVDVEIVPYSETTKLEFLSGPLSHLNGLAHCAWIGGKKKARDESLAPITINEESKTISEVTAEESTVSNSKAAVEIHDASRSLPGYHLGTGVISKSNVIVEEPGNSEQPFFGPEFFPDSTDSEECLQINEIYNEKLVDNLMNGVDIPHPEMMELRSLLTEYNELFTKRIGSCNILEHTIDTGDSKPISCHPRPMTPEKRRILNDLLDEFIDNDIVEPSNSPWASHTILTPKKGGGHRLVVDYRAINAVTTGDSYPMQRIDDLFCYLSNAQVMSKFDLSHGFYQLPVALKDREKTAFITPRGLYQFKRAPQGMKGSPASFQRAVDLVTSKLRFKCLLGYFDDLMIFSNSLEEHLRDLKLFLELMREAGFTINPNKVELCKSKMGFLGFIVEGGKVYPDPDKVSALDNYTTPKNVKDIQRFLGFAGYYRQFLENFSIIARPLTQLLRKDVKFNWTSECQLAFEKLKNGLKASVELSLPDLNLPFTIQCDASDQGIGAVLLQVKDGVRTPVWFISRQLTPAESKYSISEKECLAIIFAVKKFKPYIEFSHFTVETDHQALCWLQRIKEPVGRLARWSLELQGYNYTVAYRSGVRNRTADALSRACEVLYIEAEDIPTREVLVAARKADLHLGRIIEYIQNILEILRIFQGTSKFILRNFLVTPLWTQMGVYSSTLVQKLRLGMTSRAIGEFGFRIH